jgi:hypothetical protein
MDRQKIREEFVKAAVTIGANEGLAAATLCAMSNQANLNSAFLYRAFDDVEDVHLQAFMSVNRALAEKLTENLKIFDDGIISDEKVARFFRTLWNDIKKDSEMFEYFIKYYYNNVFPNDYANEECRICMEPVLHKMGLFFKEKTNLNRELFHLLTILIEYAALVRNGVYPDNDQTDKEVCNLAFSLASSRLESTAK